MSENESDHTPAPQRSSLYEPSVKTEVYSGYLVCRSRNSVCHTELDVADFKEVCKEEWTGRVYTVCVLKFGI